MANNHSYNKEYSGVTTPYDIIEGNKLALFVCSVFLPQMIYRTFQK